MNKAIRIFGLLTLIFLGTISCKKSFDKNLQSLLIKPFHTKEVPLDSLKTLGNMLEYFENLYCLQGDTNWPVLHINLKKQEFVENREGGNIVKIGIEPTPCPDIVPQYDFTMILEIVKDGNNLSIEGERTSIDSIPSFIQKQYLNFGLDPQYSFAPMNNGIWLCSEKKENLKDLAPIVAKIVQGYLQMVEFYAEKKFNKKFKDLTAKELSILMEEIPFNLAFKFTDDVKPKITIG